MQKLTPYSTPTIKRLTLDIRHPAFIISILIFWAAASVSVASSISLKFEDSSMNMETLAEDPAILLPLHAVAHYYKIDFQWDPVREQLRLSKDGSQIKIVLGNRHALVEGKYTTAPMLIPLLEPPKILGGAVALPPQDTVRILSELFPFMNVSWDETKATIAVEKRTSASSLPSQPGFAPSETAGKFQLRTIVIDPGHGGYDPGAVRRGIREKQIVLDIATRLEKLVRSRSDWKVIMTRDSDRFIALKRRTDIANRSPADSTLFISIHCNAHRRSSGRGLETYLFNMRATDAEAAALAERENANEKMDLAYILSHCYHVGTEPYSLEAAQKVQSLLARRLSLRNRGVKRAPFYVLAGTKMPAILVELGFVSNYYDRRKLQSSSFRQKAAQALFDAIKYFDEANSKALLKADAR
jgi:N-acetylmuramoyl-L-alanine amidase